MNTSIWPEPPADRQERKQRMAKLKRARRAPAEIDPRTPSGRSLPY